MGRLLFSDEFDGDELDLGNWIPAYLPQWSSREMSRPRYRIADGCLVLLIEEDQPPWCPEFNGDVRVSSLQTGVFAGPLGSRAGQHRFSPDCRVRETQEPARTFTQQYGRVEMRARVSMQASNVAALWLVGYEEIPEHSAEICVVEIKGEHVRSTDAVIGSGIHPFGDPSLHEEFFEDRVGIDVGDFHVYSMEWTPERVTVRVDRTVLRSIDQSPDYPMQLMLNIYDLAAAQTSTRPMEFWVDYVRVSAIDP